MEETQHFETVGGSIVAVTKYEGSVVYATLGPAGFCMACSDIVQDGDMSFSVRQKDYHKGTLYLADMSEAQKMLDFLEN